MKRIIHIITSIDGGGAGNMITKLLQYTNTNKYYHEVICLSSRNPYTDSIEQKGVKVHCLNLNINNLLSSIFKIRKISKQFDIVDTWLYHSDIIGFLISKILLRKKLIWNIRHSNLDKDANKPGTLKIIKINSFLSRFVDSITYNSNKALETHLKIGYKDISSIVIPNGFELDKFKFDPIARTNIRKKIDIGEEKVIITVGRWDIQKDYYTLLKSAKELRKENNKFKLIMVGRNLNNSNKELVKLITNHDLNDNIILLGRRDDIPALLSAADIYVSSSLGESFSNSIGEAMACELPCVVTDVGDSKLMVGDTGISVKAKDYIELSKGLLTVLENDNLNRNIFARDRVVGNYEIKKVVEIFEKNYDKIYNN